jgi:hypothetical protein
VCASTPYPDKTKKEKTKASVASATVASTILPSAQEKRMPQLRTKIDSEPVSHLTPQKKRVAQLRTKKPPLPPLAQTGTGEDVFRLFLKSAARMRHATSFPGLAWG